MSLKQCHPTIERQVAPPLEVFGSIRGSGHGDHQSNGKTPQKLPLCHVHGHKDLLRRPVLDDHVSRGKATVRRTLRVVCESCVIFSYYLSCHALGELRFDFIWAFILSCNYQQLRGAEIKMRKNKRSYAITRRGSTSPN